MNLIGIVGDQRELDVVGFGDRAPEPAAVDVADLEILKDVLEGRKDLPFRDVKITTLQEDQVTPASIVKAVQQVRAKAGPDERSQRREAYAE